MSKLAGSSVVVTGAGRGIGSEIAECLAAAGARVMLADIDEEAVMEVRQRLARDGFEVAAGHVDICSPRSCEELFATVVKTFGRVDALVNNAGLDAPPGQASELTESEWRRIIDVNLSGAWFCTSAALPLMLERSYGKIVNISSLAARLGSERYSPAYAASKAGLIGLTVGLSVQLEGRGILVNAITPGATGNTGTPMLPEERAALAASFPLGTVGPGPIADAVRYLLDSSGDWLSGIVLNVSGGQLRGM